MQKALQRAKRPAPSARCGVLALGVPLGGSDPGLWGAGCWLSGCRAVLAGQPRKSVIGVAVETGGKPIFSQPIASLAGNALGARGGHRGPPVWGGTQDAHGPTDPTVGLGKLRYPKWHRPLPGGCQRHPLNQPSATGCTPPAPRPRVSCGICDPAACPGSPRDPKEEICRVSQGPAAGTSALVLGCGWGKEKGFIKTPTVLASC